MRPHLADTPVLQTERLILRAPGAQDWPACRDFLMSERSRYVRAAEIDEGTAWRGFCHIVGMWVVRGYGSFVFCLRGTDTALGMTGPWHPADWPEREIGWTVWQAEAEGMGYAFEATKAARDHAFGALGWETAVSYVDPDNARSIALAERLECTLDATAPKPDDEDPPALVYRHPRPELFA